MTSDNTQILTQLERRRDVLLSSGDPRPLHRDLELHLLSIGSTLDPFALQILKDGLSALAFYMVSRPRIDTFGWTISLKSPPLNLFFTGSASDGSVIGRAFADHVQPGPRNVFVAQTIRPNAESQVSSVEVDGVDIFAMVEHFCATSDQHPVRFFHGDDEEVLLISALPEADRKWLAELETAEAFGLASEASLKRISRHEITFRCGCDRDRIARIVSNLYKDDPQDLFRGEPTVEAECPRCGTKHSISRQDFEKLPGQDVLDDNAGP